MPKNIPFEPPESALRELKKVSNHTKVGVSPPDCLPELKAMVANKKFHRYLGPTFEVMGVEGAQGVMDFYENVGSVRGKEIIDLIKSR